MYWQIRGAVLSYTHQKKKQSKYKRENHSIHSIYKCYMKRMKSKEGQRWFHWDSRLLVYQYETVTGIVFPARKTWYGDYKKVFSLYNIRAYAQSD